MGILVSLKFLGNKNKEPKQQGFTSTDRHYFFGGGLKSMQGHTKP
ncbi:hypothetical protein HMPREF0198_1195 [Cardiobacterium hominis ATCC 15826]|uniref:Uncharacterized protein n=1 Tax=Cardiobacterium hominis (strain ATCC 15826 / DSM 8339 / NCTC 10426 / 6573) TaxID=638300 RepID=C8N9L7_CARH6|nr:hypothetical protein HMPREF0198_1195 [Cardiobacterium hominis ATCC 15826]